MAKFERLAFRFINMQKLLFYSFLIYQRYIIFWKQQNQTRFFLSIGDFAPRTVDLASVIFWLFKNFFYLCVNYVLFDFGQCAINQLNRLFMETWGVLTYYCAFTILIIGYLLGSIPSAVWIGKKYYGIDIREHGSKNAGTTNMLRVLGKRAALPVFVIDYFKGFGGVMLTALLRYDDSVSDAWLINMRIIATVAVVLGHIFPIFAGFRGGKGVATLLGAGTAIYPPIMLMCFGVWCLVFAVSHYVSLASMVAGCCYPLLVMIFATMTYDPAAPFQSVPFIIFSWVVAVLLVWTHRKNIGRLRDGTESQIYLWLKPEAKVENSADSGAKTLDSMISDEELNSYKNSGEKVDK